METLGFLFGLGWLAVPIPLFGIAHVVERIRLRRAIRKSAEMGIELDEPNNNDLTGRVAAVVAWPFTRKRLVTIAVLTVVFGPFVYRWTRFWGIPECGEPFDVAKFAAYQLDDSENAAVIYRQAFALRTQILPDKYYTQELHLILAEGRFDDLAEEHFEWLAESQPALKIWKAGTQLEKALFVTTQELSTVNSLGSEELDWVRYCSMMALLQAISDLESGDSASAFDWITAALRCSRQLGNHAHVIERLHGCTIHIIVAQAVFHWAQSETVDVNQIRDALSVLREEYRQTIPVSHSLKGEYLGL
jgi:hypothetical protein